MINKLLDYGIMESTIDEINENESLAYNLGCNLNDCIEIIIYLRNLGIKDIDSLLLYKTGMFMDTKNEIQERFSKKMHLVDLINENYVNIDLLFEDEI